MAKAILRIHSLNQPWNTHQLEVRIDICSQFIVKFKMKTSESSIMRSCVASTVDIMNLVPLFQYQSQSYE